MSLTLLGEGKERGGKCSLIFPAQLLAPECSPQMACNCFTAKVPTSTILLLCRATISYPPQNCDFGDFLSVAYISPVPFWSPTAPTPGLSQLLSPQPAPFRLGSPKLYSSTFSGIKPSNWGFPSSGRDKLIHTIAPFPEMDSHASLQGMAKTVHSLPDVFVPLPTLH